MHLLSQKTIQRLETENLQLKKYIASMKESSGQLSNNSDISSGDSLFSDVTLCETAHKEQNRMFRQKLSEKEILCSNLLTIIKSGQDQYFDKLAMFKQPIMDYPAVQQSEIVQQQKVEDIPQMPPQVNEWHQRYLESENKVQKLKNYIASKKFAQYL